MKKIIALMFIVLSCKNKDIESKVNSESNINGSKIELDTSKTIDSLRKQNFKIYSEFNFLNFSGKILDVNCKRNFPLLAVKKNKNTFILVSILSEGIYIKRLIDSEMLERVRQFTIDELIVSNFVIKYEKNRIIAYDVVEFVRSDKQKKNFFLNSIYYIYKDKVVRYSQNNNNQRMIHSTNEINTSVEEKDLKKLFTSDSEIIIEKFYGAESRRKIFTPLAHYLMIDTR